MRDMSSQLAELVERLQRNAERQAPKPAVRTHESVDPFAEGVAMAKKSADAFRRAIENSN